MLVLTRRIGEEIVIGGHIRLTRADDAKLPPSPATVLKAMAEAGKPGPEHRKLDPLVGDWTFTMRLWTDPNQSPAEVKGTVQRKWIMGERFVQETVQGECDGKPFEGMGLLGYHNGEKKFTTTRACGRRGKTGETGAGRLARQPASPT
jgi:hypothetical protein